MSGLKSARAWYLTTKMLMEKGQLLLEDTSSLPLSQRNIDFSHLFHTIQFSTFENCKLLNLHNSAKCFTTILGGICEAIKKGQTIQLAFDELRI